MCSANGKSTGAGHPALVRAQIRIQITPDSRQSYSMCCLPCCILGLLLSHTFFYALLLHFGKGIFTLCHCTLKVCNFLFDFYRDLWLKFALRLTGGFGWGFLKSIETVKTTETHEMECLLYYEIEISLLGGQRWNTKV